VKFDVAKRTPFMAWTVSTVMFTRKTKNTQRRKVESLGFQEAEIRDWS